MAERLFTSPRAPVSNIDGVSRSGAKPEPTVIVRMEEDVQIVMSDPAGMGASRAGPDGAAESDAARVPFCLFAMP